MAIPTVYVGAYGFRDSDAYGRVWADSPEGFAEIMDHARRSTARTYADGEFCEEHESSECDCDLTDQVLDTIWYVGPFQETALSLLRDLEEPNRWRELVDDMRVQKDGYVY